MGAVKCLGVGTSSLRINSKRIGNIGEAKALAKQRDYRDYLFDKSNMESKLLR
jgi:hypothetical protein